MRPFFLILISLLLWAAVIEGGLRQFDADDVQRAAVGGCMASGGSLTDCEGAP